MFCRQPQYPREIYVAYHNSYEMLTLNVWHLFLVLVDVRAKDDERKPPQQQRPLLHLLFLGGEQAQRRRLRDGGNFGCGKRVSVTSGRTDLA